jgi:hypothetical protein
MTTTHLIAAGRLIELNTQVVGVTGVTIGAPLVTGDARPLLAESATSNNDGQGR